eukprot:TRINITY_DN944_c1_g1_i1.p1 TRINITY_DN944_c1_g1~~TRINITY_DN944_c1_g1_i1.p1  ORF type:complete len:231 (+),score=83.17 TRINITY_DN944_c1_g1_i1:85-777(+)
MMARRSSSLLAGVLAAAAAILALRASTAFLAASNPSRTGAMTVAGIAASSAALPAFAEEEGGLLNFGKVELGGGFAINLDIPETGIINIVVLVAGLLYLLSPLLSESMASREKEIQSDIDDAIAKYNEATARLAEAEKAKAQADQVVAEINASVDKDKSEFEAAMRANAVAAQKRADEASQVLIKDLESVAVSKVETFIETEAVQRGLKEMSTLSKAQQTKFMEAAIAAL